MADKSLVAIIALALVLAAGFLLVILSCALYHNWWPLFVVATYVLAPLPNALCAKCAGGDDIMSDHYSFPVDMGHFLTGIFFITGLCLPFVLAHAAVITVPAMIMSIMGGILVYSTIIAYSHFFATEGDEF